MKVINKENGSATVELSRDDLGLLLNVITEFTSGPYALTNQDDWDMVMSYSRDEVLAMQESVLQLLE